MSTLPKKDESVHEAGATAEDLDKVSAVDRETKSATVAASFTTRDHDVIRAWSAPARCCRRVTRVADVAFRRLVRGETPRTRST